MKRIQYTLFLLLITIATVLPQEVQPYTIVLQEVETYTDKKKDYVQLSGELFREIQLSALFKDSKTFVDAVPLNDPESIRGLYESVKDLPDFDPAQFVSLYFRMPQDATDTTAIEKAPTMDAHIEALWDHLIREPSADTQYSTLLPLKHPYIVPGGRFREIYYWDSFFTILGLLADGKTEIAENMVRNFADLLDKYGRIPNGNRVYYLTRSQPPFFALMVDIICRYKNDFRWGLQFLPALEKEYALWMNGVRALDTSGAGRDAERVVRINNAYLNRYYDYDTIPREESYKEDYLLTVTLDDSLKPLMYRNLRSAAESGWDFSSRWFADGKSLSTINTTDILPVDLNCLLWFLEDRLSYFNSLNEDDERSTFYRQKALNRLSLINEIFWNEEEQFYFDYNWRTGQHTKVYSPAACYPFYFGIAYVNRAEPFAEKLKEKLLKPGGLVSTPTNTGQQWDAPNGWAPQQWMAIKGLREYKLDDLADEIKTRWLTLNESVYKRTGKMVEKYNVEDLSLFAGGGEYPLQDGFGWTNGVAAALLSDFDRKFLLHQ